MSHGVYLNREFRLSAEHDVRGRGGREAEGGGGGGADGLGLGGPGAHATAARLPQEGGRAEGTDRRGRDHGEGKPNRLNLT